jgi:hypothetical protein
MTENMSPDAQDWALQVEQEQEHAQNVRALQQQGIQAEVRKSERIGTLLDLALVSGTAVLLAAIVVGVTAYLKWVIA